MRTLLFSALLLTTLLTGDFALADESVLRVARGESVDQIVSYGQRLEVEGTSRGDAIVYGGDLEVSGTVEEDAVVFGGDLRVRGSIGGNAHAYGGRVVLEPGAKVGGRVTAVGGEVVRSDTASVAGAVAALGGETFEVSGPEASPPSAVRNAPVKPPELPGSPLQKILLRFVVIFGLAFLARAAFPRRIDAMELEVRAHPLRAAAAGLLASLLLLPFSILLGATFVGLPLVFALWLLFFGAVAVGAASAVQASGRLVPMLRKRRSQTVVLAAGALLLSLLALLPWLGWLVYFALGFTGVGAAVMTRFGRKVHGLPTPLAG